MTNTKIEEMLVRFISEISTLNTNMKNALDKISNHENRIMKLEDNKTNLKDQVISWLIKCLICSIAVIASLTGASSIVAKIFGL